MPRSVPIASISGTAIRLHWTFLLFLAAIGAVSLLSGGAMVAAGTLLLVLLIFLCVVLHEFGHIRVARMFGVYTPEVILLPIGGMAKLQRIPERPQQELAVAVAGPAVNFVLFAVLVAVLGRWPDWQAAAQLDPTGANLIEQLAFFNLAVGLFNLLPAFPMDGGRILRALLAFVLPRHKATRIAAKVGQALAIALAFLGGSQGNFFLVAIGIFIFIAATSEAQVDTVRHAIGGIPVGHVMVTDQPRLMVFDPILDAADAILHSDSEEFPVLHTDGHLAGFLIRKDMLATIAEFGPAATVGKAMRSDIPVVSMQHRAERAAHLIEGGAPVVGVVDRAGDYVGLINWRNLLDVYEIESALGRGRKNKAQPRSI